MSSPPGNVVKSRREHKVWCMSWTHECFFKPKSALVSFTLLSDTSVGHVVAVQQVKQYTVFLLGTNGSCMGIILPFEAKAEPNCFVLTYTH